MLGHVIPGVSGWGAAPVTGSGFSGAAVTGSVMRAGCWRPGGVSP
ncbi:hypothetical protein P376_1809 [Streptomyces sp. HCCB10043]|nr:hypothetical protein P376_1809 [Streptomyces sp. HCCB10043]